MVKGLDLFKKHFRDLSDRYVMIGGTACMLIFEQEGLSFRATKDLDIVLVVEALDADFVGAFWEFVRRGGYKHRQKSTGKPEYYRFDEPEVEGYPVMIELFSRVPDSLSLNENSHLAPIPVEESLSSLSAILLDDDYYHFIRSGRREIDGLPLVGPEHLIPLKAKACLDLSRRKQAGESVDGKDIRKHRNDVFRLYSVLSPLISLDTPDAVRQDMVTFLDEVAKDPRIDLSDLGIRNASLGQIVSDLKKTYGLT